MPNVDLESLRLETPRLILRPIRMEDFDAWAAWSADSEAMRHLGGALPRSMAWRTFMTMAGAWHLAGFSMFSVIEKATGNWVGRVGPWQPEGWPGTEVGWAVVRSCWGKGYATEAATAAIDWAFDSLGWIEVIHTIEVSNVASQGVAKKLGAVNRGRCQMPAPHDKLAVELWGQTREEWRVRRSGIATPKT
jgi:RimJ/RimL family protein N-acetyltransferase